MSDSRENIPPLLIALPDGINVSGVTMWAVRLVNALVERGGRAGVIRHPEPKGQVKVGLRLDSRVQQFECAGRFGEGAPDLAAMARVYSGAVEKLGGGGPVMLSPNLVGDCYGIAAKVSQDSDIRVLAWHHADNEYDARVLTHYEPVISRFVAVSDAIEVVLHERLGAGAGGRVVNVPHGVDVPREWPARRRTNSLRLLYTGRIEHMQKRVLALVHMSDELSRRRIEHSLTLIGDGPASAEVDAMFAGRRSVRRFAPLGPRSIAAMLEEHDALVLASRYEGLSVSVIEAMAHGCVPIVARTRSGANQALGESGVCGLVVDVGEDAEEEGVGAAMAGAVARFREMDRAVMSLKAWERARELFSIERHVDKVVEVMRGAVAEERRVWPRERACGFTGTGQVDSGQWTVDTKAGGSVSTVRCPLSTVPSGSVPADGPARMKALLDSLAGRSIVIHGTGEHTRQLKEVIVNAPVRIVAFTDDDRGKHGTRLWDWPVISPREAGVRGASDVVISSWMHQEAVWGRRGVYEGMGVRVWRVYEQ